MIDENIMRSASELFPFLNSIFQDKEKSKHLTFSTIKAGTYAFNEGKYYHFIPLILKGTIRVSKIGENGREIVLYRISKGESCILLLSSALSSEPYTATAYVEEDTEVLNIPISLYQEAIVNFDLVRNFTYQLYNKRIANMLSLIEEIVFNKMDKRIAEFVLNHTSEHSNVVELTHEALAIELGTAREVVSRILKEFEKKGFLKLSRGKIIVLNHNNFLLYYQKM
ncbi:hypothetical protein BHF71_10860 [Vulcanibacillus modesticaldus]|uniref:Crp/Fnr family transcriptional regulator n=1 Tax=Vulcanibacillus modesticaldus TaxID=337097 RepID=A0A1D2YT17_9BACI|nr:Crp/Fnr family transcriptional regulator [Vulcanibacillus modesticaldus]OEF98806.1 hypothetical protein BHF71_10860 [Vulcanibacillus modesticaldus]